MAVVMLAFGSMLFGCDVDVNKHTQGEIEVQKPSNTKMLGDTTAATDTPQLLGEIAMPMGAPAVVETKKENCNVMTGAVVAPPIMGDLSIVQDTIDKPVIDTAMVGIKMGEAVMQVVERKSLHLTQASVKIQAIIEFEIKD